ncbi:MAG: hypothetical protein JWN99_2401 [Ilumatobacteraceae bacterium]|nr:hypothetical protein [Ilumatobacteraceae bacterium]
MLVEPAEDLSHQLWTMRELLEQLVYKLEVQGLLLAAGRARWVPYVTAEIEAIIEAISEVEVSRSAASTRLARQHGRPPTSSLSELVDHVDSPWSSLLSQHRLHLLSLQAEIEEMSQTNHEMARRGLMQSREIIASLGEQTVDVYVPRGLTTSLSVASLRLDRTV